MDAYSILYSLHYQVIRPVLLCIVFGFVIIPVGAVIPVQIDSVLSALDTEIDNRHSYIAVKERQLVLLKNKLANLPRGESRFDLCSILYSEYQNYQFDSVYAYADRMYEIAIENHNRSELVLAYIALLDCYTSVGFFKEAAEVDKLIEIATIPKTVLPHYYILKARMFQNLESYVGRESKLGIRYAYSREACYDSILSLAPVGSYEHDYAAIEKKTIWESLPRESIDERLRLLTTHHLNDHQKAINCSLLSNTYKSVEEVDSAIYFAALAVIYDIRSSTRENTAAKDLAILMQQRGDLSRASRYIHLALDDAETYNSRIRQIEVNSVLPSIENARYMWLRNTKTMLIYAISLFVLLLFLLFLMYAKIRRRNRSLSESNVAIRSRTEELDKSNEQLSELNSRLKEVNEIKDRYIIESIKANQYVNEVAEMSKTAIRKLNDRKYDEVKYLLYDMGVKKEWQRLFSAFDRAFMKLFPNFVDEYNKLFPKEHQVSIDSSGALSTEIRIFALMRLGIDNPTDVAKYLNLSTNTIYVYKAKTKAKTLVPKEEFDDYIMAIPKP